ncbi:MAG: Mur ligase domain-containing protein, partial [Gemella haemolysans]|nr:Mur ligase domain-containing protein [Gemella haemolysans]
YKVSGSDREESDETNRLKNLGVEIFIGQKRENIKNPDLIVYTDAILDDNEELIAARELGVDVVSRGVFLGALMRNYKYSIGVSGSHGKSTTTSMIAKILIDAKVDPSILLGGKLEKDLEFDIEGEERHILEIRKAKETPNKYPRKAGTPNKKPLL